MSDRPATHPKCFHLRIQFFIFSQRYCELRGRQKRHQTMIRSHGWLALLIGKVEGWKIIITSSAWSWQNCVGGVETNKFILKLHNPRLLSFIMREPLLRRYKDSAVDDTSYQFRNKMLQHHHHDRNWKLMRTSSCLLIGRDRGCRSILALTYWKIRASFVSILSFEFEVKLASWPSQWLTVSSV